MGRNVTQLVGTIVSGVYKMRNPSLVLKLDKFIQNFCGGARGLVLECSVPWRGFRPQQTLEIDLQRHESAHGRPS
jgi:hypothetical protein